MVVIGLQNVPRSIGDIKTEREGREEGWGGEEGRGGGGEGRRRGG